jgi:GH18 family chitinase
LVVAVDSLTHTLADERNASALLVGTLRGQLTQSRLETGREHDMVIALSKRPTRLKAVGFALASAGLGYAAGKR